MNNFRRPSRTLPVAGNLGKGREIFYKQFHSWAEVPVDQAIGGRFGANRDWLVAVKKFQNFDNLKHRMFGEVESHAWDQLWGSHCEVAWQAFERLQSFMAVEFAENWTLRTAVSCIPGEGKPYLYPCRFDHILWKKIDKKFDQFVRRVIDCCTTMGATAAKVKHVQVGKQLSRHNYSISHHMSTAARALPPAKVWLKRSTHSSKVLHSPRK